jgi:hypothetical protein
MNGFGNVGGGQAYSRCSVNLSKLTADGACTVCKAEQAIAGVLGLGAGGQVLFGASSSVPEEHVA